MNLELTKSNKTMSNDLLRIQEETEEEFIHIADELMNNYAIETHESLFRIIEIEFYWNSPKHQDASTYERKYVNPKQGDWFFHYSGVDIALRNDEINGYGGILIRAIFDVNSKENKPIYNGPMICAMKLFSGTNAFSESIKTRIIKHKFKQAIIQKGKRKGQGNNAKSGGTDKLNYRFFISPNDPGLRNQ
jgi:hypothetical protein